MTSGRPFRIGHGFDVHRFSTNPDRPLILGGVLVSEGPGLEGHSDADALAHALADALLGAAGLGDLGRHFPDTDPTWSGADSIDLLRRVMELVIGLGFNVLNADCTVVAERPRMAPYVDAMSERLRDVIDAPVNVKATRSEGLGALGRAEGIGCLATVLIAGGLDSREEGS